MGTIVTVASTEQMLAYDLFKAQSGQCHALKWLNEDLKDDDPSFNVPISSHTCAKCAEVYGHILGPLHNGVNVDVGLLELDDDDLMDPLCATSKLFPGQTGPELVLGEGSTTPVMDIHNLTTEKLSVYGSGAYSAGRMEVSFSPHLDIYPTKIGPDELQVFKCINAPVVQNWHPGDSGTWCWTDDGEILGMGFGVLHGETNGDHRCLILPMGDVVTAIHQLLGISGGGGDSAPVCVVDGSDGVADEAVVVLEEAEGLLER
jgi:hypothetical protein